MLTLASRSPQRRAILEQLGIEFRVEVPDVAELAEGDPKELVTENARRKAYAVERRLAGEAGGRTGDLVLGADTAVVLDGRAFGKPTDRSEAETFLRALSGRSHEVHGGICLRAEGETRTAHAITSVRFRTLDQGDLDRYLESGEWRERAGGYAIQLKGATLVEEIAGDYSNVVGLPVPAFLQAFRDIRHGRNLPGGPGVVS